jgi:protein-disulfide isomerase
MSFGGGGPDAPKIEAFLDVACPFSCKLFKAAYPAAKPGGALAGKATFAFEHIVQPWHAQSEVMHSAVLAVRARTSLDKALAYTLALCEAYDQYTDAAVVGETRIATAARLAEMAERVAGVPKADVVAALTRTNAEASPPIMQQLKWVVRQGRARGVHVTPTVFVNGIEAPQVSSSWTVEQWANMLDELAGAK